MAILFSFWVSLGVWRRLARFLRPKMDDLILVFCTMFSIPDGFHTHDQPDLVILSLRTLTSLQGGNLLLFLIITQFRTRNYQVISTPCYLGP
jgi:hypothetical protein